MGAVFFTAATIIEFALELRSAGSGGCGEVDGPSVVDLDERSCATNVYALQNHWLSCKILLATVCVQMVLTLFVGQLGWVGHWVTKLSRFLLGQPMLLGEHHWAMDIEAIVVINHQSTYY